MMYLIYNNDGSIKLKKLNEFLQQGNNYVNEFFVAIVGRSPATYDLYANFKLPNGMPSEVVSLQSQIASQEIDGETYYGRYLTLSSDQTQLEGTLKVNLVAKAVNTEQVLVSYTTYLTINEGLAPNDPVVMTRAEYENLIAIIGKNVIQSETIYVYDTYAEVDVSGMAEGQVFYVRENKTLYQYAGGITITTIADLSKVITNATGTISYSPTYVYQTHTYKNLNGDTVTSYTMQLNPATTILAGMMSAADKTKLDGIYDYIDQAVDAVAAFYITKNAQGDAFATRQELMSATTFYSGGVVRVPTRNDYCIVRADETHDNATTRYLYDGTQWNYQYLINETPLTQQQIDALNSGITSAKVSKITKVEVSETGTSTNEINYITITDVNGTETEYKIAGAGGSGAVSSVNGQTGDVVLSAEDIKIAPQDVRTTKQVIDAAFNDIDDINELIPSDATSSNKLATRSYVTSVTQGSVKAVTISYNETAPTEQTFISYEWRKPDGTVLQTYQDFLDYVGDRTCVNSYFNSQADSISFDSDQYIISRDANFVRVIHKVYLYGDGIDGLTKSGDIIFVEETNVPDRWLSYGTTVLTGCFRLETIDLSGYAKTNESNTFIPQQTFSGGIKIGLYNAIADLGGGSLLLHPTLDLVAQTSCIRPYNTNLTNIGKTSHQFKDGHFSGNVYAQNTFNVINASDIAATSILTQAQFDLITNGKPTRISGTYQSRTNILLSGFIQNGTKYYSQFSAVDVYGQSVFGLAIINESKQLGGFGNYTFSVDGLQKAGIYGKAIPNLSKGYFAYDGTNLYWVNNSDDVDTSSTTYSGALTSSRTKVFTQALTSLGIITNGFTKQNGDNKPSWSVKCKIGSGFTFTSADTIVWKNGTPNWTDLVGEEVEILFEQSLVANTYNAWII